MDLIDVFRAFHPKAAEYTSTHVTFSRIDHMLGHKTSLNKFKKIEVISKIFSEHNAVNLEINHKKNIEKHAKTWKLNNMFFCFHVFVYFMVFFLWLISSFIAF